MSTAKHIKPSKDLCSAVAGWWSAKQNGKIQTLFRRLDEKKPTASFMSFLARKNWRAKATQFYI